VKNLEKLLEDVRKNRFNKEILHRLSSLELKDTWLVAGSLFQTVWNIKSGKNPEDNINDYDIFYYDKDISYEAEDAHIKRVEQIFSDLPIVVELRNQARVPLWYKKKFDLEYPEVANAKDNISRFFFECNCIGISYKDGKMSTYAPFGIEDIYSGVLRSNHTVDSFITEKMRMDKAKKYISRWPWLRLIK